MAAYGAAERRKIWYPGCKFLWITHTGGISLEQNTAWLAVTHQKSLQSGVLVGTWAKCASGAVPILLRSLLSGSKVSSLKVDPTGHKLHSMAACGTLERQTELYGLHQNCCKPPVWGSEYLNLGSVRHGMSHTAWLLVVYQRGLQFGVLGAQGRIVLQGLHQCC